jgi:hypothetical protein
MIYIGSRLNFEAPPGVHEVPTVSSVRGTGALLFLGGLLSATSASAQSCETIHLDLVERPLHDTIVDVGYPDQDSVGDLMIWSNDVYDDGNSAKVGDDSGWCIRTRLGKTWECTFTISLQDGRISTAGSVEDRVDPVLAVIGGTGAYRGVTGQLTWLSQGQGGLNRFQLDMTRCPAPPS